MIIAMARDRGLCDEFTENFSFPEKNWERLKAPEGIAAWIGPEHIEFARQALAH